MKKIAIIGGCGRIGLPLGLILAHRNHVTTLFDLDKKAVEQIREKRAPFKEIGLQQLLQEIDSEYLNVSTDSRDLGGQDLVIFCTPSSDAAQATSGVSAVLATICDYFSMFGSGATIVVRSTLYVGEFDLICESLKQKFSFAKIAYCPERISQGNSLLELQSLPQLISATDAETLKLVDSVFSTVTKNVIALSPAEAVMAKLMTNSWRYLEFSIANHFYQLCSDSNLDFNKIRNSLQFNYPRAKAFAKAGLTAGPCLARDNQFLFPQEHGVANMNLIADSIHNKMPYYLVAEIEKQLHSVAGKKIGLLGLAFKPDSDDLRNNLTIKVKEILETKRAEVLVHDPFNENSKSLDEMKTICEAFILCVPHSEYQQLKPLQKPHVDSWGFWN